MSRALIALVMAVALLGAPSLASAQSAGDEQYVDPFQGEGGGQQEPAPPPEQPSEPAPTAPTAPAAPAPAAPAEPAPGGNGTVEPAPEAEVEAGAAQSTSPTLPRTGAPVVLLAAIGYGLLVAGIAIRRKA